MAVRLAFYIIIIIFLSDCLMQIPKKGFAQVGLYISLSIWFILITLVHFILMRTLEHQGRTLGIIRRFSLVTMKQQSQFCLINPIQTQGRVLQPPPFVFTKLNNFKTIQVMTDFSWEYSGVCVNIDLTMAPE